MLAHVTKGLPWVYTNAWGTNVPASESALLSGSFVRAMQFQVNTPGRVVGIRFAVKSNFVASGLVFVIGSGGLTATRITALAPGNYSLQGTNGVMRWQNLYLKRPLKFIAATTTYLHIIGCGQWRFTFTTGLLNTQGIGTGGEISVGQIGVGGVTNLVTGVGDATFPMLPRNTLNGDALGLDLLFLSNTQAGV